MAEFLTPKDLENYGKQIPRNEPIPVLSLKEIANKAFNLWIDGIDNRLSAEELETKRAETQDRVYKEYNDKKDAIAYGMFAAAAAVNVYPIIGQVISAVLAAIASIVRAVPVARSMAGPDFTYREISQWVTYRGFTRQYTIVLRCKATDEGKAKGFGIGGPGTPDYCSEKYGGIELKQQFIKKVDTALLNYAKYFNIKNIFDYFPVGPASKNPSAVGDRSPALYLIEVLDELKPYENSTIAEKKATVDFFVNKSSVKRKNKLLIYGLLVVGIWFIGKKKNAN